MKKMPYLLFCLFSSVAVIAQTKVNWDTLKYQKFKSNLIVGVFQSYRNFNNSFQQYVTKDSLGVSKNNYSAESKLITGIEFVYDKFSLALGLKSDPQKASIGKGSTRTLNADLNVGGNIWFLQNSLRYFKGFYDKNTGAYDTTIRETGVYYQRPDIENTLFRSKFLYFTNHKKFAFRAGYAANYRQLKSAATWVMSANLNYFRLRSDSSFFALSSRPYFGDYGAMNRINVFGISANGGAAVTLVILKGFFINSMFIVGPEQQWRTYAYQNEASRISYISISGDFRFSIGFNLKRFYVFGFNTSDFAIYNSSAVGLVSTSVSGGFTFGWRFNSVLPELYKKLQQTKFYQSI
jgi:hypothetical protein